MTISHYGRILQNLTNAYDEMQKIKEIDYPGKAELASYFIAMSIDATQNVVRYKLGHVEANFTVNASTPPPAESNERVRAEPTDHSA